MYKHNSYVSEAQFKFNELSEELQKEVYKTYDLQKEKTPEVFKSIVEYYYNIQKSTPIDWFQWWE